MHLVPGVILSSLPSAHPLQAPVTHQGWSWRVLHREYRLTAAFFSTNVGFALVQIGP